MLYHILVEVQNESDLESRCCKMLKNALSLDNQNEVYEYSLETLGPALIEFDKMQF